MIDALSAAAASLSSDMSRLNSISHNLANATTPGYKRQVGTGAAQFAESVDAQSRLAAATGAPASDQKQGAFRTTGSALDVALDGDGFFEVQMPGGMAYTRRGDFRLDASGQLVTQAGHPVMGVSGPLVMRSATPVITKDGRILEGDQEVGQLKVVRFADPRTLVAAAGGSLFTAPEAASLSSSSDRMPRVMQGGLEASNVNTAAEMVRLVETVRHFEAVQKVVQGMDEMTERALRKLGEF